MNRILFFIIIAAFVAAAAACGDAKPAATAAITKLATGKNDTADPPLSTFDLDDGIYAVATVSNPGVKHNLSIKVTCEKVAEREKGSDVMNKSVDVEASQSVRLQFGVAYPGEYKVEATLTDDIGKKVDSKSEMITVTGSPAPLESDEPRDKDREKGKDKGKDPDKDRSRDKDRDRDERKR